MEELSAEYMGHAIEVVLDDDGDVYLRVDGLNVPIARKSDGSFSVAYSPARMDPISAARVYVERLE